MSTLTEKNSETAFGGSEKVANPRQGETKIFKSKGLSGQVIGVLHEGETRGA